MLFLLRFGFFVLVKVSVISSKFNLPIFHLQQGYWFHLSFSLFTCFFIKWFLLLFFQLWFFILWWIIFFLSYVESFSLPSIIFFPSLLFNLDDVIIPNHIDRRWAGCLVPCLVWKPWLLVATGGRLLSEAAPQLIVKMMMRKYDRGRERCCDVLVCFNCMIHLIF